MVKAVVVGQSFGVRDVKPEASGEWSGAFMNPDGYSTRVLLGWLNSMAYGSFALRFDTYNVVNRRGERMPESLITCIREEYDIVVLLGADASRTILGKIPSLKIPAVTRVPWSSDRRSKVYVLPHPSGKNRQLNNQSVRVACARIGKLIAKKVNYIP